MALLVTGNWYEVTWLQTNDAAWAALSPPPGIPSSMADAFVNGTTMVIYVTNAAGGEFVFLGGTAAGFDDTLLASDLLLTAFTWTTTDAVATQYVTDSSSDVWVYDSAGGTLRQYPAAGGTGTTAFKAYLP
jgi:hypothetical protein